LNVNETGADLVCESCDSAYPITFKRPVLLRSDNDVFRLDDYRNLKAPTVGGGRSVWKNLIPKPSINLSSQRILLKVREALEKKPSATVLVVGSGHQRQWLNERLGSSRSVRVIYSDIDAGADVDLFCDGHDLPFMDVAFDAVVTTAVLEHVLYPERVAAEIMRVLKYGGLLYSELPFMQQVHEGAYDFTRYTMSGHKRLFNSVSVIESGLVAGPGTALVWAIENFWIAFMERPLFRNITKAVTRLFLGWIKYFDLLLVDKPGAMDGASCTYLLGRKIDSHISDAEIISQYVGAQGLRHT
jgi:SAM-dependent methyltransferase